MTNINTSVNVEFYFDPNRGVFPGLYGCTKQEEKSINSFAADLYAGLLIDKPNSVSVDIVYYKVQTLNTLTVTFKDRTLEPEFRFEFGFEASSFDSILDVKAYGVLLMNNINNVLDVSKAASDIKFVSAFRSRQRSKNI